MIRSYGKCARNTSSIDTAIKKLNDLFLCGVEAVKPKSLFHEKPEVQRSLTHYEKRYHVIGFGKAVLGMAVQMEQLLGPRLRSGFISIPVGTTERFAGDSDFTLSPDTVVEVIECARDNLPDEQATMAAKRMKAIARSMSSNDVLCVLVSGGGSALLCLPKEPVTLAEKLQIIKSLAGRGAAIDELNRVRIALSDVKGGQLALAARNAFQVYSYLISDIVGDPVALIASGPTVVDNSIDWNGKAKEILVKYNLWDNLPKSVSQVIGATEATENVVVPGDLFVLGSNEIAVKRILERAHSQGLQSIVLSTNIQGYVSTVTDMYVALAEVLYKFKTDKLSEHTLRNEIKTIFDRVAYIDLNIAEFIANVVRTKNQTVLIVGAGEPTVCVEGDGKGGRNQELALRFSYRMQGLNDVPETVCFLSAGTDGIDGPTDVAGAIGGAFVVRSYDRLSNAADAMSYIERNDSYRFYRGVDDGKYFVKTGHTGTNVMDLHLMLVAV